MAELLEYTLAVLVSSLFIAGSVGIYGAFSAFETNMQLKATFASVTDLANTASIHGTARADLNFPPSTLSCTGGRLSLSTGASVLSGPVPYDCQFSVNLASGTHSLSFSVMGSSLTASVT